MVNRSWQILIVAIGDGAEVHKARSLRLIAQVFFGSYIVIDFTKSVGRRGWHGNTAVRLAWPLCSPGVAFGTIHQKG